MTTTSKDEIFADFHLSYDNVLGINSSKDGVNPSIVQSTWVGWEVNMLNQLRASFPEQMSRMASYFNNYQQWTIESITYKFSPRYPRAVQTEEALFSQPGSNNQNIAWINRMAASGYITWVQDMDDVTTRNTLDEYYQVRDQPNAMTRSLCDYHEYSYRPFLMDTVLQNSTVATGGPPYSNVDMSKVTSPALNMTAPIPMKWFATKSTNNTMNGTVVLNQNIGLLGVKVYMYTPFNDSGVFFADRPIGLISLNYKLKFKYPDYRAIITVYGDEQSLVQSAQMQALIQLQGEAARLTWIGGDKPVVTDLGQGVEAQRAAMNQIPGPSYDSTLKRMRDDYQGDTQPDPKRQVTPVDPDSKQTSQSSSDDAKEQVVVDAPRTK